MTFQGTLQLVDVEGGTWLLRVDDGRTLQLLPPPRGYESGERVVAEGQVDAQGVSFQMAGPILRVERLRRL